MSMQLVRREIVLSCEEMFPMSLEKAYEEGNAFWGYDWGQGLEETLGAFQEWVPNKKQNGISFQVSGCFEPINWLTC